MVSHTTLSWLSTVSRGKDDDASTRSSTVSSRGEFSALKSDSGSGWEQPVPQGTGASQHTGSPNGNPQ